MAVGFLYSRCPWAFVSQPRLMSILKRSRVTAVRGDPLTEMFGRTSAQISVINGSCLGTAPRKLLGQSSNLSPRDPSKGYVLGLQGMVPCPHAPGLTGAPVKDV